MKTGERERVEGQLTVAVNPNEKPPIRNVEYPQEVRKSTKNKTENQNIKVYAECLTKLTDTANVPGVPSDQRGANIIIRLLERSPSRSWTVCMYTHCFLHFYPRQ